MERYGYTQATFVNPRPSGDLTASEVTAGLAHYVICIAARLANGHPDCTTLTIAKERERQEKGGPRSRRRSDSTRAHITYVTQSNMASSTVSWPYSPLRSSSVCRLSAPPLLPPIYCSTQRTFEDTATTTTKKTTTTFTDAFFLPAFRSFQQF